MPTADKKCAKPTHVYVKKGCEVVKRVVYENAAKGKYIKMDSVEVPLATIRGKYRNSS